MARNYLLFWLPETVEFHSNCRYLLQNVGSSQIQRASMGDTIWIVTTSEGFGLGLAGRLRVGDIVPLAAAKQLLQTDDLWHSEYHSLAEVGTAERMKGVGLGFDAEELRFVDGQPDRFISHNGQINSNRLKQMRELDSPSVQLMERFGLRHISASRFDNVYFNPAKSGGQLRHKSIQATLTFCNTTKLSIQTYQKKGQRKGKPPKLKKAQIEFLT